MPSNIKTKQFSPLSYELKQDGDKQLLIIEGERVGQPTKRFTINRTGLKIAAATITHTRKNKTVEHTMSRINYLPTFGQTRLHTQSLLYPGHYKLILSLMEPLPTPAKLEPLDSLFA